MHYYQAPDLKVHALEDKKFEYLLPPHCVEITETQALLIGESNKIPLTYKQKRAAEYPSFADFVEGYASNNAVKKQAFIDACLVIQAKYPEV